MNTQDIADAVAAEAAAQQAALESQLMNDWLQQTIAPKLVWDLVVPLACLLGVAFALRAIFNMVMTLHVSGTPTEWVIIMNNGKMKRAGVGLSCFRGPFDQVAKFPARVNKVTFRTEQVTKEMQGVMVEGMLVWTINRTGDGPFNAYKNLGEDLVSLNP